MLKLSLAAGAAIACCTSAHAQNLKEKFPVNVPVRDGGTLDWHTGKWKRSGGSFANAPGATVIYDNTCTWSGGSLFGAADSCEWIFDQGRIPTRDPNDPIGAATRLLADTYLFCGYSFSYCTGELSLGMEFGFVEGANPQTGGQPVVCLTHNKFWQHTKAWCSLPNVPASNGHLQACWTLTIDLSNTPNAGYVFTGNNDEVFDGDPGVDLFLWSWRPSNPVINSSNPTGLLIMGEPATVITGGEGSFDIAPATDPTTGGPCGSGLDTMDNFWINTETASAQLPCTTPTGCYSFGGYPGNPFASWSMTMFAVPIDSNENFENYCTPKASSSGCLASVTGDSGQPVSGANDWNVTVTSVEGNRPGIFFTANTAQANIPFQGSGTLCMFPPLKRGQVMFSFGTLNTCDGSYAQIINDMLIPAGFDAGPGGTSFIQAWYRDQEVLDTGTALSDAIQVNWAP